MVQQSPPEYVAIRIYVPRKLRAQLKAKLALQGSDMTEWFRAKAEEEINAQDTDPIL